MEINQKLLDAMADRTTIGVYEVVREIVEQDPEMSTEDLVALLAAQAAFVRGQLGSLALASGRCVHCGEEIAQPRARGWFHPGRIFERSCFAASRRRDGRGDLSLDAEWVATPT